MSDGICIFGGSFDPVHKGHKKLALFVCEKLKLRKMLIVPAFMSPFKSVSGASAEDRMNMCKLSFCEEAFEVSPLELSRGGKSYTIDTVKAVKELYPQEKIYLLIGSDQLLSFNKWYRFSEILEYASLLAVSREKGKLKEELEKFADENIRPYGECIILDFEPFEVSSTEIREKIAAEKNAKEYLCEEVSRYILSKGLYGI